MAAHQMRVTIGYDGTTGLDIDNSTSSSSSSSNTGGNVEYTIVAGDTLWGIAQNFYGDGNRWPEISAANDEYLAAEEQRRGVATPTDGSHWIFSGQVITIPGVSAASTTVETTEIVSTELDKYTIKQGDTLWAIAQKYYNDGKQYTKIYDANKDTIEAVATARGLESSDNGHWIFSGTTLVIPGTDKTVTKTKKTNKVNRGDTEIGTKMTEALTQFTYIDVAYGESDSVEITLADVSRDWIGKLLPKRGAIMHPIIRVIDYNVERDANRTMDTGLFVLDDISFNGHPFVAKFKGVAKPVDDDFSTEKRTKTWESVTLKSIAQQIANTYNLKLIYEASNISISDIEQNEQPDGTFLKNLCDSYDVGMKLYAKKLVLYDITKYEARPIERTIDIQYFMNWSVNSTLSGTYTGVEFTYTDPDNSKEKINVFVGKRGRVYKITKQASSEGDARLKARAALDQANRKITTLTLTGRGHLWLYAGQTVGITGIGKFSGKYFIEKIRHQVNNGYTCQYTLHKCINEDSVEAKTAKKTFAIGNTVHITGIYVSSDSTEKLVPLFDTVTIGRIVVGARNPYLVNNSENGIAIGWCNEEDMS